MARDTPRHCGCWRFLQTESVPDLGRRLDKVVHVWEFREGHPRSRRDDPSTIGVSVLLIHSAAVSAGDRENQRLPLPALCDREGAGAILVFRLPGKNDTGTGLVISAFVLCAGQYAGSGPQNHAGGSQGFSSTCDLGLHFLPAIVDLASRPDDKTIRIWDLQEASHANVAVLTGTQNPGSPRGAFVDNDRVILHASGGVYTTGPEPAKR